MEFADVVRRRRMVRTYTSDPVPRSLVEQVLRCGLRAPSAGFSQGWAFLVLEGSDQTAPFWSAVERPGSHIRPGGRLDRLRRAPVVIVPLAHKQAYLARYSEPDKAGQGLDQEEAWPAPYWDVDTAFATMAMLLAATDLGLGALFFGLFADYDSLYDRFGVPRSFRPIGAMTLGWPAEDDVRSPSLQRGLRPQEETIHFGHWSPERSDDVTGTGQTGWQ